MDLFRKHGIEVVGFWTVEDPNPGHELVYLTRFESRKAADSAWAAFREDPEWIETRKRSEANGPIVDDVIERTLAPTGFSALQ